MMADVEFQSEGVGPPVVLPVFSGPLDLLLHLIQKDKLSIYDIPIAQVCDQYHAHLDAMEEVDLELAGEFLWMAAWLLQLKSRLLLPRSEDEGEDPRLELVERLLEYRRVKELASFLHEQDTLRRCLWEPALGLQIEGGEPELDLEAVDLHLLAQTYLAVMQRFAAMHPPPLEVLPLRFKVEDTMRQIYQRVHAEGLLPLLRHLHTRTDAEEVVVLVVSALELARLGGVVADQRRAFAEIYLRPGPRHLDLELLFKREESDGA
jgi:segregation and condensation protein A